MARTFVSLVAAAVAAVSAAAPAEAAGAAKPTTVRFKETERSVAIATDAGFPAVGTHQLGTAILETKAFGKGDKGQIFRLTATASKEPGKLGFTLSGTDFFAEGTQRWRAKGTATIASDGVLKATGTGTYIGGTGRFRDARGSFTLRSNQPAGSAVTTTKSKGSVTF